MNTLSPSLSRALFTALSLDDFSDVELIALQEVVSRERDTRVIRKLQNGDYTHPKQEVVDTYKGGDRIYALRMYREQTGCGLVEGKQVLEYHCEQMLPYWYIQPKASSVPISKR